MTLFIDLINKDNKESALKSEVTALRYGESSCSYKVSHMDFSLVKGSPFSYWVSDSIRKIFGNKEFSPLESEGRDVQSGATTGDDFRFLRLFWEVSENSLISNRKDSIKDNMKWVFIPKGGGYSKFYSSWHLVCNWAADGKEIKESVAKYRGDKGWGYNWSAALNGHDQYFRPGITWSRRTTSGLSLRVMPSGCIFADKGPAIFSPEDDNHILLQILAITNSRAFEYLVELQLAAIDAAARSYEVGIIETTPFPSYDNETANKIAFLSKKAWLLKINIDSDSEVSPYFNMISKSSLNGLSDVYEINKELSLIEDEIDEICFKLYGFNVKDKDKAFEVKNIINESFSEKNNINKALSLGVGIVFGRFNDQVYETEEIIRSLESLDPFEPMPGQFLSIKNKVALDNSQSSSLGFESDILADNLFSLFSDKPWLRFEKENFNKWVDTDFFNYHLKEYSKSRRQAPIYWPLQTASGSYTIWVYYHSLNQQALYICINDFVEPKLDFIIQDLNTLRNKPARSSQEEKELTRLADLEAELRDFRDELLRIAKFWKPNLNDGVQITAAPLWKLFQHKAWQKKLKDTWEKLEEGDYDWAHLACSVWPERVLRKCHQDRSLAIAHDVEDIFWHEVEVPVKRGAKLTGQMKTEWQPKSLTATELTELINQTITELK